MRLVVYFPNVIKNFKKSFQPIIIMIFYSERNLISKQSKITQFKAFSRVFWAFILRGPFFEIN
jgi:hypothetical protein